MPTIDEGIAAVERDATTLAETLREIAGKIDPANHVYRTDGCVPEAEWRDYWVQTDAAFRRAMRDRD